MDVRKHIEQFLKSREPLLRDSSFDYCFNYFQGFREKGEICELGSKANLEMSCLQLGFYLGSWGMFRGSAFLSRRSVRHYEKLITAIPEFCPGVWTIDVDSYDDATMELLIECAELIRSTLGERSRKPTDTLVSKVMLGVFGNVPAFDRFLGQSLHLWTFGKRALKCISDFYEQHREDIDKLKIPTLDFSGGETSRLYTRAKLVDMVAYVEGENLLSKKG